MANTTTDHEVRLASERRRFVESAMAMLRLDAFRWFRIKQT